MRQCLAVVLWLVVTLTGVVCAEVLPAENLLVNPDFSLDLNTDNIPDGWGDKPYHSTIVKSSTGQYLHIVNTTPQSSIASQRVALDGRKTHLIRVSARLRVRKVVTGGQPWENAKIQVLFFDSKGDQIADWPEVGSYTGTMEWTPVSKVFQVPRAARSVLVNVGLWNCKGDFDIADIAMIDSQPKNQDPYEYIVNGGFEVWQGWVYGGASTWGIEYPGYIGDGKLHINNKVPMWSFASQSIRLDAHVARKVHVSGYMKIKKVKQGDQPWEQARVNVEFRDAHGQRIGGWPIVGEGAGSFDWRAVEGTFDVPAGTEKVLLFAGLLNCTGEVYIDELSMKVYDANGRPVKAYELVKTDTALWSSVPLLDPVKGGLLDLSSFLSPPAGHQGPVQIKDGHFYFENGDRARFLGVDVFGSQLFQSHDKAVALADRIARCGFNLVRLHHLDAAWANPNIFDPTVDDTRHFSPDSLDKLDYFVNELEKRGIYIYLDLLVHRGYKKGDGIMDYELLDNGAKVSAFIDPKLMVLQKEYAAKLLGHTNPYTGHKYCNDPALAMVDIVNENSLFYIAQLPWLPLSVTNRLDKLWGQWLLKKYKTDDALANSWVGRRGIALLGDDESMLKGTVKRGVPMLAKYRPAEALMDPRIRDTMRFYYELESAYFKDMAGYLRGLGLSCPLAGSNHWENIEYDIKANAIPELDYIDRHMYWNHPQFGYGVSVIFDNQTMLKYPQRAIPAVLAAQRIAGKPYVVSEWNTAWPGDYYFEGPAVVIPYARYQDWDALIQFSFNNEHYRDVLSDNFDISALPNVLSQLQVAVPLFYGNNIEPATHSVIEYISDKALTGFIEEDRGVFGLPRLSLVAAVSKTFDSRAQVLPDVQTQFRASSDVMVSDTGQLTWDGAQSRFSVETDAIQGAVGALGTALDLSLVSIRTDTPFCSVFLIAKDGLPLAQSKKILLLASARAENTDMIYNSAKTQIIDIGDAPIILEFVEGEVTLRGALAREGWKLSALDLSGKQIQAIPIVNEGQRKLVSLKSAYRTLYYLLERE